MIHSPILNAVPAPRGGGEISLTVFDFLKGDDMFYSALNGNGEKLDSLDLEASIPFLSDGNIHVIGYGDDFKIVKIRCNRVKSELIVRYGLKEESFTTSLKAGTFDGISDVVVITLPAPVTCSRETQPEESAPAETVRTAEETLTEETVCTVPEEEEVTVNNLPPETTQLSDNPVTEPERPEEKRADGFRGHWQYLFLPTMLQGGSEQRIMPETICFLRTA